ncbi:MAG TPA: hypothetical protein EYG31_03185 [Porticoccaceae bacterium]|nr:hypothetical protein [Gammaproteobacteria bacterium]HIL59624.1 hypothetical protein [Porticoccaceae bacterium]
MKYLFVLISLFVLALPVTAEEAPQPVIQVTFIDTNGDNAKYLELYDKISKVYEETGNPGERTLWGAGFAGTATGSTILTVEYPSMTAMAEANIKTFASKEYQALSAEFQAAGMSFTDNSLMFNIR